MWVLLVLVYLSALGGATSKDWWIQAFPDCWQRCISNTDPGCQTRSCMCSASENTPAYLSQAISCAVDKCDANEFELDLFLGALDLYCAATNCAIPEDVLESASAAAGGYISTSSTRRPNSSIQPRTSQVKATSTSNSIRDLASIVRTTIVQTTTDPSGNRVQILVPIAIGPSGASTGHIITSTVHSSTTTTTSIVSLARSSSSAAQVSLPTATQGSATSTSTARVTQSPARGNGSPFENMQAGVGKEIVSLWLLVLGGGFGAFWGL